MTQQALFLVNSLPSPKAFGSISEKQNRTAIGEEKLVLLVANAFALCLHRKPYVTFPRCQIADMSQGGYFLQAGCRPTPENPTFPHDRSRRRPLNYGLSLHTDLSRPKTYSPARFNRIEKVLVAELPRSLKDGAGEISNLETQSPISKFQHRSFTSLPCMSWPTKIAEQLSGNLPCGYQSTGPAASEPTALAGLALAAHGQQRGARQAADWLADRQSFDGSVGVTQSQKRPKWPTSLAILTWTTAPTHYQENVRRAIEWTLSARGSTSPRKPHIGHDTTLTGWSWAADTHSWLEPTAMFVLALKSTGHTNHPRTREAVRMLIDRLLPDGGANYGNTIVLGQPLLAHIQPTGLAMMALAGEGSNDPRLEKSLTYLEQELGEKTPVFCCRFES